MPRVQKLFSDIWKRLQVDRPVNVMEMAEVVSPVIILDDAQKDDWENYIGQASVTMTASQSNSCQIQLPDDYEYVIHAVICKLGGTSSPSDAITRIFTRETRGGNNVDLQKTISSITRAGMHSDGTNYWIGWPNNIASVAWSPKENYAPLVTAGLVVLEVWYFQTDATVATRIWELYICGKRRRLYNAAP